MSDTVKAAAVGAIAGVATSVAAVLCIAEAVVIRNRRDAKARAEASSVRAAEPSASGSKLSVVPGGAS